MNQLSKLATIVRNSIQTKDLIDGPGIPVLKVKDLLSYPNIDLKKLQKIEKGTRGLKQITKKGDILIILIGPKAGELFLWDKKDEVATNLHIAIITSDNNKELFKKLISKIKIIKSLAKGITIKSIPLSSLKELEI